MRPVLTDWPRPLGEEVYERETGRMVERIMGLEGVAAVYRLGSSAQPGISDVDLVAVFEDGAECRADLRDGLDGAGRYVFTHGIFGAPRRHFPASRKYSGLTGFTRLDGKELAAPKDPTDEEQPPPLRRQIALEFLLRMHLTLTVARVYGVYRVRSLLLQAQALRFDLDLLGLREGPLPGAVMTARRWREGWFEERPPNEAILRWTGQLHEALANLLDSMLRERGFAVIELRDMDVAPHLTVCPGGELRWRHRGLVLPSFGAFLTRKYINLQNRWNRFVFQVPMERAAGPLREKAAYDREAFIYNSTRLPKFIPLKSPLNDRKFLQGGGQ